jgi:hypothetical protein
MKKSIGDFAESLILGQVKNIKEGKEPSPIQKENGLAPAGRDISKVKVPDSFMKQILGEQFTPQDAEPVDSIPELVWNKEEPKPEPVQLNEQTLSQLIPLLEEVRDLLTEMTTCGSIGVNLAEPKGEAFEKTEKRHGYMSPTNSKKSKKAVLKASIAARLKRR